MVLIAVTLFVATVESGLGGPATSPLGTAPTSSTADLATVEQLVREAPAIRSVPASVQPPLGSGGNIGYPFASGCDPIGSTQTTMKPCLFGDPHGSRSIVLYGDSHSGMWFQTIDDVATAAHWKLWYLGKAACPVELLPMVNPGYFGPAGGEFHQCDQWHTFATAQINRLRPDLVIVTQESHGAPGYRTYSSNQWRAGLVGFFSSITVPNVQFDVIGNIPQPANDPQQCLNAHAHDVPACSTPRAKAMEPYAQAEAEAVTSVGGRYIDVTPWFCSSTCTAVIGNYQVYFNQAHVMGSYATSLGGVMADALQLPASSDTVYKVPTGVLRPANGAVLSGTVVLFALARAATQVQFTLTGRGYHDTVVATGRPSSFGWLAYWNSTSVPNGTYTLESRARVPLKTVLASAGLFGSE